MADRIGMIYSGRMPNLLCCDATLRRMPDGSWVTVFLSGGTAEPLPENNVFLTRSTDRGATWSPIEPIFDGSAAAYVPSEMIVADKLVYLYVSRHDGHFWDWESLYTVSEDSGRTWSELRPIPHRPRQTFVRNLYIRGDGTWVLPYQHYIEDADEAAQARANGLGLHRTKLAATENGVMLSGDQGRTWTCLDGIRMQTGRFNWAENNVIGLSDGTLAMLIRMDRTGTLYRADSRDGGVTWSEPAPTGIPNPGSKFRLFGLSDGRIALVHNPSSGASVVGAGRNPLALWISGDDMKSWTVKRELVRFPGELAYPDGFVDEREGMLHLAFDYNRHDVIYCGAEL